MAVKVWLPLNGDTTTNNGLSAITASITDDTHTASYAAGILGHRGFSSGVDTINFTLVEAISKFSVSMWIKENSAQTGDVIFTIGSFACTKTATGYSVNGLASGDLFTLESGWNNVVITADGTKVKAYVNGAEVENSLDQVGSSIAANSVVYIGGNSSTGRWPGVISDFKICDHVMSLFEAYSEAHGLVVNYTFNGVTSLGSGVTLPTGTVAADWGFGSKEYDLSGNEYDATFGTVKPAASSDSALYSASFNFNGADAITSPAIDTTELATRYTVSVWAKGSGNIATFSNGGTLTGAADTTKWHNIVVTSDGKKYVDGVESGTLSGLIGTGNCTIAIGGAFTGLLSDFRVYAVALSADEVEALYKRKAAVDASGKMIASEFVSLDDTTGTSFGKNGVVSSAAILNFTGSYDDSKDEITGMASVTNFAVAQSTHTVQAVDVIEY